MSGIRFRSDVSVILLEAMGDDSTIVRTARVDRAGGWIKAAAQMPVKDLGLLNLLMRDRHGTPWESVVFRFVIEAPLFVAREAHRHRIGLSVNEVSGRYRELEPVFYLPGPDRKLVQTGKPGAYVFEHGSAEQYDCVREVLEANSEEAFNRYQDMLQLGIAKEVARMALPVNIFTAWYLTINLRALLHFLSLRQVTPSTTVPTFPQREIEMVAELMEAAARTVVPESMRLFDKHGRVSP